MSCGPRGTPEMEIFNFTQSSLARGPAKTALTRSLRTLVTVRPMDSAGSIGASGVRFPSASRLRRLDS
jgi:hypothetical protein